ncbi:MAG TPA: hypothetical protein VF755_13890 [Catenuloplanes sp.]
MTTSVASPARPMAPPPWLRLLIAVQLFVVAFSVVAVTALYLAGLAKAGSHAVLVGTPVDPKDVLPLGFHWWNPFTWLYAVMASVITFGWIFAGPMAVLGLSQLARAEVRARPRLWVPLLVGSVGCAAFLLLMFSPLTFEVRMWLAD